MPAFINRWYFGAPDRKSLTQTWRLSAWHPAGPPLLAGSGHA
jgi:hypothetical protein